MAETTKRSSNNANVAATAPAAATPKAGTKVAGSNAEQALNAAIGSSIQVQTASSSTQGMLYTACPVTSLLAIASGPPKTPVYHVIPLSALTSFTILSPPPSGDLPPSLSLPIAKSAALQTRANAALAKAKERAAKTNSAVGKDIQDIFDTLDKQFSARWHEANIVVMERVTVRGPGYKLEDCRAITKDGEGLLARVKKVLEHERRRASQRDPKASVKPAIPNIVPAVPVPQGPRKGG